jgi:hypothetical protein
VSDGLEWTEIRNEHHAHRDKAHYVIYPWFDGKWRVPIFKMLTGEPDQREQKEQKLGQYLATTLEDGKQIAQALADQRRWTY